MKLSEMRDLLSTRGIQLTKSLGQNFLHDRNQVLRIVELAELAPKDQVLEVGPGLGPLTEMVLDRGARVLAIEKDRRLCAVLAERFADRPQLELLHADALGFLKAEPRDWTHWKLVSNLPYSVGSPILVELALASRPPERLVATLQWEVVRRILAEPGTPDFGQLTLLVQLQFEPVDSFKIPPGSFFPPPEVDSACVLLRRRDQELLPASLRPEYMRVVKLAFSARRKMMAKLLKGNWPAEKVAEACARASIAEQARAETVSLEQFVRLTAALAAS
jgi:16S rRNA (adenine1518-N6/adenine1519-N6)-dimethyltransferase